MDKKKLLDSLKNDLSSSDTMKRVWDSKRKKWSREYDGEPYGNEQDGKSKIISRDIKRQSEWLHSSLIDPFVSSPDIMKASPITWEDQFAAEQNQIILNTQFCRQFNRYRFMTKAVKVLDKEGSVVVQTGWDYSSKKVKSKIDSVVVNEYGEEEIKEIEIEEIVVTKNQPGAIVCRNEDVFVDPTCQDDMDKCQFIIHRYETDFSTLKNDIKYTNLDEIQINNDGDSDTYSYNSQDSSNFKFQDDPRKKLLVYEYWGNYDLDGDGIAEPIVCAWVGDTIIRLQTNPYPDGKPPFLIVPFNSVPFQLFGESNAEIISDKQKVKTAIFRGIIDNMALSNNGQKGMLKGSLDTQNRTKFLNNENFEFNRSKEDFWDGSYNQIPSSAFNVLSMISNEIDADTGIKSFSGPSGSTAIETRGAMDATSARRVNLVRNISENLIKPLLRKWMSYNSEFLSEEEVIRITNDKFVSVKKDDLLGNIDIDIQVSTTEDNQNKARELSMVLQTLGPNSEPEERRFIQAEIAKLQNMPALAKKLEDYKPNQDEIDMRAAEHQIEMERRKLVNDKLRAEINRINKSALEDEADAAEKYSQASHKNAQTGKIVAETKLINSKTDNEDLSFIEKEDEVTHRQKMELKEQDRLSSLDLMAFQKMHGGESEQIGVPR
ncbi:MAG: hypothetical protein L3I99_01970 [Sulfurimonas sp.]|nr:hypothetical protein [Sulfurimonas sp.]